MTADEARPGTIVGGRYALAEVLGQGGMGTVWLATDSVLRRDVAVKEVLLPGLLNPRERDIAIERSLREARAAAGINHPNVITVYDVVRQDERPWIVMEYLPGRSLEQILAAEGPLPPARVAVIGSTLLKALQAAHRAGIQHRDVKPSNVLIRAQDQVVLTDFGIASISGDASLTRSGVLLGAPGYIAPERARGEAGGPSADLWSLGATLYAAVEGRPLYDRGSALATLTAIVTEEIDPPVRAGVLGPLLDGLLRRNPDERIDSDRAAALLRQAVRLSRQKPATGSARVGVPFPTPAPPVLPPLPATPGNRALSASPAKKALSASPAKKVKSARPVKPARSARAAGSSVVAAEGHRLHADADGWPTLGDEAAEPTPDLAEQDTEQTAPADEAPAEPRLATRVLSTARAEPPDADRPRSDTAVVRPAGATPMHRRPVVLGAAALAVLVIVAGVVIAIVASNSGGAGGHHQRAGAGGTPGTAVTHRASKQEAASASPSAKPSASSDVPAGYHRYRDPSGFSLAIPDGWQTSHDGHLLYVKDPHSSRFLMVDQSDQPKSDPVADWTQQESQRSGGWPGYQRVGIRSVDYFEKAADWEFTYDGDGGVRTHVINRGVVTSAHQAYGLFWSAPDAQWDADLSYWRAFTGSLHPKP